MGLTYFAITAFIVIITVILIIALVKIRENETSEDSKRLAGRLGEEKAVSVIRSVLKEEDLLFTNVSFVYDGRPAETDCIIVHKFGVFIIEVKNYVGKIIGSEKDFEWTKYKLTERGNVYEKTVKNPVRQVKRQIYLLAKYLDYHGVRVWVKGYALFILGNSPIKSESILCSAHEIDKAIHTKDREFLSYQTIEKIKKLLD